MTEPVEEERTSSGWYLPASRVTKLQCLVTSYQRPLHLERCLDSMRQCDIELFAVDGDDRDEETSRVMDRYCDRQLRLSKNPGADVLRNVGLQTFITDPVFVLSSDDYVYPAGWADSLLEQWYALKTVRHAGAAQWGMIACPTQGFVNDHEAEFENSITDLFSQHQMLRVLAAIPSAAGLMIDTALLRRIGGFPVYGRWGHGLIALSIEMDKRRQSIGYVRRPVVTHLWDKEYPAHGERRQVAESVWRPRAIAHKPGERNGVLWPADMPGDAM